MSFHPDYHHRRSIRLPNYDYSQPGMYFVTICTDQRQCLFGQIENGTMQLNELGRIVQTEWLQSPKIRAEIELDEWIIMPNHLHGIVIIERSHCSEITSINPNLKINPDSNAQMRPFQQQPRSLTSFIAGFKASVTRQINIARNAARTPVWQRGYYEHIIRNPRSLQHIRTYIHNNPMSWHIDQLHPNNPSKW